MFWIIVLLVFSNDLHAEEEILIKNLVKAPSQRMKDLLNYNPELLPKEQKHFNETKEELRLYFQKVEKITSGEIPPNCKNIEALGFGLIGTLPGLDVSTLTEFLNYQNESRHIQHTRHHECSH